VLFRSLLTLPGRPVEDIAAMRALRDATAPVITRREDGDLHTDEIWTDRECQVVAAVPIRWQSRLVAALLVGFADAERLTAVELELLDEIGRQVALGMERLRLQGRVQDQQNEMAVVAERNRIARDMHDGLVQYVYALGLQLEHARDLVVTDPTAVAPLLTGAIEQTNHVLSEMRTFIYQMRPIIMKEKEIGQWVLDLCRQFQQATGIVVKAEVGESAGQELSPEISIALFRIIQEALSNIYKHAQAKSASLALDFGAASVRLQIEDDGHGFLVAQRPAPAMERGRGLANIEERVRDLGAELRLDSTPGRGTRLEAEFPYSR